MAVDADSAEQELEEPEAEPTSDNPPDETDGSDGHEPLGRRAEDDIGTPPRIAGSALRVSLAIVVMFAGLIGWLGYRAYQVHQDQLQRNLFLQIARQGALNLTTINYTEAEADVQRIVDSATGAFRDDFTKRSQPFIDVVKQAQSKSQGVITEAAVESEAGNTAQVLVAVTVNTSVGGVAEPQPRAWRMRIVVQKVDDGAKISNVEFVP
ncbi:mammalian cell entry protein [Mycobacterium sp. 663a-19]|uniref:mammalian cell entry protein n=1 Tax=Mycobacterium sp. 663a-19 TaxID=2986148 RepID=UPI002D1F18E5|nr:mammalian cell entry protein [Mycobacterium sp. 663a-19]MEB3980127.1 mammalian cell entry protein [Mycobacterium sp. 663a-19]